MTQANVVDDFPGFSPDLRVRMAVFQDLGAYGKETCKMSENKVVHHKNVIGNYFPVVPVPDRVLTSSADTHGSVR